MGVLFGIIDSRLAAGHIIESRCKWSGKMSERTSKALIDALFDELDALKGGKSTPQQARAVSSIANTVCSVTRLEMDYARFVSDARSIEGQSGLKALPMGGA
jgi:hypothetical protein